MKRLKVAQIGTSIFPIPPIDQGGTERVINDLSLALQKGGVDVTVFGPSDSTIDLPRVGELPSLSFYENSGLSVSPGVPAVLDAVRMEDLRTRMDEFDIIHCHCEFIHAPMLGEMRNKAITTIHWRTDELDRKILFEQFPDLKVVGISRAQESNIPASNRAGVVYHGLDADRYAPGTGAGDYLAFVGRLTDQKAPDMAIRVASQANVASRIAGTIDVGNPGYFDNAVKPLLNDANRYVGPVKDAAKMELLQNARALLFPVTWPEPFGLVMIEAMACGTPVIAWRNGSTPEIVEDGITGYVVDSLEEAVQAVERVKTLCRKTIRNRFVERFSADRMARDYIDIYKKMLRMSQS